MFSILLNFGVEFFFALVIISIIVVLMRKAILSSNSLELPPDILPIIPEKNKTFGESAANVKVGLYVHNFPQFNMLEGNFSLDGMVWFEFNPSQVSLVDLEKFEFLKGQSSKNQLNKSKESETKYL